MRLALIFPPATAPTSPPLGIATLKPCLESAVGAKVRNFDLNLAYFEQAFRWIDDGRLRMRIRKMDIRTTARKAVAAKSFFQGKDGVNRFFDPALYNEHAAIYARFSAVLNGLFDNFSRKILVGMPTPPLAHRFFDELIEPVKAFEPDLIGFSVLFSQQLFFALALAKLCGRRKPPGDPPVGLSDNSFGAQPGSGHLPPPQIIFGGATFSVMPDPGRLLAGPVAVHLGDEPRVVDASRLIDYLIVGEGERGLESLARQAPRQTAEERAVPRRAGQARIQGPASRRWARPAACRDIPGLLYVEDGKVMRNPAQAVSDLNVLPVADFSDFPLGKYHSPIPVLPYLSSRGCPWRRCAFCTHQKTYLDYREEDAAISAQRLTELQKKHGVSHFCLVDEMVHQRRMERIASELIRSGARVRFSVYARPSGFSPRVLEKAHKAGLRLVMWGIESASQRILDLMCKGTNAKDTATILDSARKVGIWNLLFLIFGFPTETGAEWLGTLDFLEACRESVHALSRSRFVLLEGSDVFSNPQRYGIKRVIDRPERDPVSIAYDYEVTQGLTQQEVLEMFHQSQARLSEIGRSPWFGHFREHMLLFASNEPPAP
ncbi:MAG TPA: B12-binding domain-containing radical SAM protein [Syntrophobacteraceae bacterium]|nr:B12-binding domain-containing radical SAM protein [Syntrophobacteraceae bacterium]